MRQARVAGRPLAARFGGRLYRGAAFAMNGRTQGDRFVMKDLSAAERRLIAALDRMDHAVERAARRMAELAAARPAPSAPAGPDAADVSAEIAALHDRQAVTVEAMQQQLGRAHERLAETGARAAQLAAANDALARANRQLSELAGGAPADWAREGGAAILAALEAELAALRAARAAEIAHMGEILDALDRMLGVPPASPPGPCPAQAAALPLGAGDVLPEDSAPDSRLPPGIAHDEDPLPEDLSRPDSDTLAEEPR